MSRKPYQPNIKLKKPKLINFRKTKATRLKSPVVSIAYLNKHINRPTPYLESYFLNTRADALRNDLYKAVLNLKGAALKNNVKTTGITRLLNDIKKANIKDFFTYKKLAKRAVKQTQGIVGQTASDANRLFAEAKYLTKNGKIRKRKIKQIIEVVEPPTGDDLEELKLSRQQLDQVITLALKTDGLAEQIFAGGGFLKELSYYLFQHITTTLNSYVPALDLMSEMFETYEIRGEQIVNLYASQKTYFLSKNIAT